MPLPHHRTLLLVAILVAGCGQRKSTGEPPPSDEPAPPPQTPADAATASSVGCERLEFEASIDVAEASGAAMLEGIGLVIASDSGARGGFVVVDPTRGSLLARGVLPLSRATSDDIEGLSFHAGRLFAITSSGWIYTFEPSGASATELSFKAIGDPRSVGAKKGCAATSFNCGDNFEGLCVGAPAHASLAGCAGLAVAKGSGELMCLETSATGALRLDASRRLEVNKPRTISGCTIDEAGTVWVTTNILAANVLIEVTAAAIRRHRTWAIGSIEAIERVGRDLVLLSDMQSSPSAAFRYRCIGSGKSP